MTKSESIRTRIGLTRQEWARALNVNDRTVARWEEEEADPGGLASDVIRGIERALDDGADPKRTGNLVLFGIGTLVFYELKSGRKR
jgi:hypothetical protein